MTVTNDNPTPNSDLFEILRAEHEGSWLFDCFVPPVFFEQMMGFRSCVVFGDSGSGRTALYRVLQKYCESTDKEKIILVKWKPKPYYSEDDRSTPWINEQIRVLFDACALSVFRKLVKYSDKLKDAPEWVIVRISWFLQNYLLGDALIRVGPLLDSSESGPILQKLFDISVTGLFYEMPSPEQAVSELFVGLKFFGIQRIWVVTDDMDSWVTTNEDTSTKRGLTTFLSMLSLFENTDLTFKLILRSNLEVGLSQASGIVRRRLEKYKLNWDLDSLRLIVEKRLALLLQKEKFALRDLCNDEDFENWLFHFGGYEPRQWLELAAPFIQHYQNMNPRKPLDAKTSKELRLNHPPRFYLDDTEYRVKIGGRVIPLNDLPPKVYTLLTYLYKHAGEVISKDKLYYLADQGLDSIPVKGDKNYIDPIVYSGQIDTNIYRLRQVIEPDPKNPIILQTERGYGVRLAIRL